MTPIQIEFIGPRAEEGCSGTWRINPLMGDYVDLVADINGKPERISGRVIKREWKSWPGGAQAHSMGLTEYLEVTLTTRGR